MSLFGKILAVFNLLGVAAFAYMASVDFSKQKAWEYANFRHDLVYNGLPLDDKEKDKSGEGIAERISPAAQREMFAQGNPVTTQVDEVKRVRGLFTQALTGAGTDKVKQLLLYSRFLLPLAESNQEREGLISIRANLSNPKTGDDQPANLDAFKASLLRNIGLALRIMRPDQDKMRREEEKRTFADALGEATQLQHDEPRAIFLTALLAALPKEGAKPTAIQDAAVGALGMVPAMPGMDEETEGQRLADAFLQTIRTEPGKPGAEIMTGVFDGVLTRLVTEKQARFDGFFKEALEGQVRKGTGTSPLSPAEQKQRIVHVLLNLVEVTPEQTTAKPAAPAQPEQPRSVLQDPAYRRIITVVGLPAMSRELERDALRYRTISGEISPTRDRDWLLTDPAVAKALDTVKNGKVQKPEDLARLLTNLGVGAPQNENLATAMQREQTAFVLSHQFWINYLQQRAAHVDQLAAQVQQVKGMADGREAIVKSRQADLKYWNNELAQLRLETTVNVRKLEGLRKELFNVRVELRNNANLNQQLERDINYLEDRVR